MKKKGMAIPLVLIFATIMGIVSLFLFKSAQSYNRQNLTSFNQLQSYFIARAGVEHAMLKIKYLNRELYDAICLSQGRNPLFDFSQIQSTEINQPWLAIKSYNPGPIFLYKFNEFTNIKGVFTIDFKKDSSDGKDKNIHKKWIEVFESDITSDSDNNQSNDNIFNNIVINRVLDFSSEKNSSMNDVYTRMRDPFTKADYKISDLSISASEVKEDEVNKVDNSVIVEFKIISLLTTARNEEFNYEIKKTVKVSRD